MQLKLFHGTNVEAAKMIIGQQDFIDSTNDEDWLGKGVYSYDNYQNALEYIMYAYKSKYKKENISYDKLFERYTILEVDIEVDEDRIFDFNEFFSKYKYVIFTKAIFDKIKDNSAFVQQYYKDGFLINFFIENTNFFDEIDLTTNIFIRELPREFTLKSPYFKSRIAFEIKQRFYCLKNHGCIKNVSYFDKDTKKEFDIIKSIREWENSDEY